MANALQQCGAFAILLLKPTFLIIWTIVVATLAWATMYGWAQNLLKQN